MKIIFNAGAPAIPDAHAESFAEQVIAEHWPVVTTSNACVFNWLRAVLFQIPPKKRPEIQWFVGDTEVHFEENLRSADAWFPMLEVQERALEILLGEKGH